MSDRDATIEISAEGRLLLRGHWIIGGMEQVQSQIHQFTGVAANLQMVDASQITRMDTAGAFLFQTLVNTLSEKFPLLKVTGLNDHCAAMVALVAREIQKMQSKTVETVKNSWLYCLGKQAVELYVRILDFFGFLGEVFLSSTKQLAKPFKIQWKSMINEIDLGGYRALPIVGVMMLLIGVVVAYQLGIQLEIYGANAYIVDLSGIAIFREFSPLISSVIIAGRTSTSFAALIGTMKVNEEIDVLRTMGLSPIERLVLPRMIALVIALPLLVVWGDIFGVLGSMVMTKSMMGITYQGFLIRFKQEIALKHFFLGLIKTPVFALVIAGVGCFQGFQAERSAESVGLRTTKAAVQAIFLIIFTDALFSILFNWMKL